LIAQRGDKTFFTPRLVRISKTKGACPIRFLSRIWKKITLKKKVEHGKERKKLTQSCVYQVDSATVPFASGVNWGDVTQKTLHGSETADTSRRDYRVGLCIEC